RNGYCLDIIFGLKALIYLTNGRKANQGDLVVATTSENIEDVGKALVWLGKDELGIGGHSCILKTDVDTKYLSYVFETVHFQKQKEKLVVGTKVIELYPKNLAKIVVPVPPLIVQKEIVKILDKFSEYVTELTAELTLRQKQYSFYRDKLLSFEGEVYEVEWKTLEEICDVRDGTHDSPTKQNYGNYLITSKNVKQGSVTFENAYYISPEDFEAINKRSKVDVDDLLFTMIGTVGEVAHVVEEPDYAIKNVGLIKTSNRVLSRYLFHYLQSSNAKQYIEENKSKGSQVFLALGKIRKFPIPYVSHNIQSRIVQVLDNFDTVCNDLNIGLPKEIEQRQKQYEFIRDKLLTFTAEGVYAKSRVE
ncbi:restriction endonuclease subunit S, partial [Streptococcus loxodontisalivarius]|uniref:restriction endonuclease subunit S n=1 Tax=Streptococcus loxodontisalivarius TaxID=1349415 RepID=UPI00361F60B6